MFFRQSSLIVFDKWCQWAQDFVVKGCLGYSKTRPTFSKEKIFGSTSTGRFFFKVGLYNFTVLFLKEDWHRWNLIISKKEKKVKSYICPLHDKNKISTKYVLNLSNVVSLHCLQGELFESAALRQQNDLIFPRSLIRHKTIK